MKVCVQGLWHLGSVTAACMASVGHEIIGFDADGDVIDGLSFGNAPVLEPGLDKLIQKGLSSKNLSFSKDRRKALSNIDVLWVAYDTPVNDEDEADVDFVLSEVKKSLEYCPPATLILISSQLPIGSIGELEKYSHDNYPNLNLSFACSPENLRLGNALAIFFDPDRIIVGFRTELDQQNLKLLLQPLTKNLEWMTVESAEMTKHAINGFFDVYVSFNYEIAYICEKVVSNAKEVERGLKSEHRIGNKAYVSPGASFAGGTLARDINFLHKKSLDLGLSNHILASVRSSNDNHKNWVRNR